MSIDTPDNALRRVLNRANPDVLADLLRYINLGNVVSAITTSLVRKDPVVNSYNLATVTCVTPPEFAKASFVLYAFAHVGGSGTPGFLICDPPSTSPGTAPSGGHCQVTPNGDIGFLGTDLYSKVDLIYVPLNYKVIELTLPIVTGVLTLPTTTDANGHSVANSVLKLLEAEILTVSSGTNTGKKIILTEAASGLPATTKAQLLISGASVNFNDATDHGTSGRVKLAVQHDLELSSALIATAPFA